MDDADYMRLAIAEAEHAAARGEVPVGAVLVNAEGAVIARAGNAPIAISDPSAHAEMLCLRAAACDGGNYRLGGTTLYVTLEPCTMCAGALSFARVERIVYGATDAKGGAVESGVQFFDQPSCHHTPSLTSGILAGECAELLTSFFRARRKGRKKSIT